MPSDARSICALWKKSGRVLSVNCRNADLAGTFISGPAVCLQIPGPGRCKQRPSNARVSREESCLQHPRFRTRQSSSLPPAMSSSLRVSRDYCGLADVNVPKRYFLFWNNGIVSASISMPTRAQSGDRMFDCLLRTAVLWRRRPDTNDKLERMDR
jgi:hypothetical protein